MAVLLLRAQDNEDQTAIVSHSQIPRQSHLLLLVPHDLADLETVHVVIQCNMYIVYDLHQEHTCIYMYMYIISNRSPE